MNKVNRLPAFDLFGMATSPTKRTNDRPEAVALIEVLKALRAHPAVVWCERMNSGATRIGTRWVKFGFVGCPTLTLIGHNFRKTSMISMV